MHRIPNFKRGRGIVKDSRSSSSSSSSEEVSSGCTIDFDGACRLFSKVWPTRREALIELCILKPPTEKSSGAIGQLVRYHITYNFPYFETHEALNLPAQLTGLAVGWLCEAGKEAD